MSQNNYPINMLDSKKYRHVMPSLYKSLMPGCETHYLDGDSHFEKFAQKKLDIDLLIEEEANRVLDSWEEKLALWPGDDSLHTAMCIETETDSNPGRVKKGWFYTCQANHLIYSFEILPLQLLDVYHINFPRLKEYVCFELERNPRRFGTFRNTERNRSQGLLVGLGDVYRCVKDTKRYLLHFDGRCQEVDISFSLSSLLKEKVSA